MGSIRIYKTKNDLVKRLFDKKMLKSCKTCRHDPKSCKFQNYNDKCNGHQLVSITEIIKERDKLQVLGLESEKLTEQIEYFYYGRK